MLFSITLKVAGLKGILSAVKTSYEEALFRIDGNGILFYEKHAGSPTATIMMWKKENMQEFNFTGDEQIIGFRTDDFDKILKRCDNDAEIIMSYDDNNSGFISLRVGVKSWELRIISPEVLDEIKEPNIPHTALCIASVSEFKEILSDVGVFSDRVHFVVNYNRLYFKSKGMEGTSESQFVDNRITSTEDPISVEYSLDFINDIMRAVTGIFPTVKIHFGNKIPLLLEFELEDFGVLKYYLGHMQVTS